MEKGSLQPSNRSVNFRIHPRGGCYAPRDSASITMNAFPFPVSAPRRRLSGVPSWNAYYVGRYGSVVLENGIIGWIGVNLLEEKFTPTDFVDWKHVENPLKDGPSIYCSNGINISSVLE